MRGQWNIDLSRCEIVSDRIPPASPAHKHAETAPFPAAAAGLLLIVKKCSKSSLLAGLIRTSVRLMKTSRIDNATRWQAHLTALQQFATRMGSARVPASHTEVVEGRNIALGAWVGYMRQRNRAGLLSVERKANLESVTGWTWGPLRPGPASNTERDNNIVILRSEGLSLEKIAIKFGISRQRVHQIARSRSSSANNG